MYCSNCGLEIPSDSTFCTHCGTPVGSGSADASRTPRADYYNQQTTYIPRQNSAQGQNRTYYANGNQPQPPVPGPQPAAQTQSGGGGAKTTTILLAVAVTALVIIGGLMLYNHTNLFHDNSGSTTAIAPGTTQGTTEITTTPSNTAPSSTPQNGATTTTAPQQEAPSSTPSSTPSYSNTTVYAYSGDVFPDSSSRYLTSTEVKALSSTNRSLARNEIYARHGYHFKSGDLWSHFYGTGHYTDWGKSEDAAHSEFNAYEKANVKLIKSIEKS